MSIFFPLEFLLEKIYEFSYGITGSYGFSLIILSIIVSTILLPIYNIADKWRDAEKSAQKRLQADIDVIKSHYKGQERYYSIRTCYRIYGYKPIMALRVSLGFLIQIPFFFAAYQFLFVCYNIVLAPYSDF
jgi:membrane protein insertase Oxa1/YidC/SpoIIIJ